MNSAAQSLPTPEEEFRRLHKIFETNREALSATDHRRLFELASKLGIATIGRIIREVQIEVDQERIKRQL